MKFEETERVDAAIRYYFENRDKSQTEEFKDWGLGRRSPIYEEPDQASEEREMIKG